jgi:uncharacterized protein YdeI (YjbR/CyaY-like superfamily)
MGPGLRRFRIDPDPDDLVAALSQAPNAARRYAALCRTERYAVLHPIVAARTPELRAKRIARAVERLEP